jgi:polyisoprenoid-binding protein YceI
MITKVRGRFTGVTGAVTVADDPEASSVAVTIDLSTVDSGDRTRDDHLRSADLFDVDRYPTATLNREDYGLTWNMVLDSGGLLVSRDIHLEIEVETIRQ